MSETGTVAVIGGGLGGLTAGIALLRAGFDVTVYEQAAALGEVGAGVQMSPNATRVFKALGLYDGIREIGFEPDAHVVRGWKTGDVVSRTPMKGVYEKRFGTGYFGFHRADLLALLEQHFPRERIRLGMRCEDVWTDGDRAVARFADGTRISADAVIGADGIHSVVRERLFGPAKPRFTGDICWRGLVPAESLQPGLIKPDMTVWLGPHSNVAVYYIRGGRLVNWIASHASEDDWREESWRKQVPIDEPLAAYRDWNPALREMIANTSVCYKWALHDRDPLPEWTQGRITLLGDSAHPMLPYLAQGACMAIEDGYALALALTRSHGDVPAALRAYEAARRPRTARVQLAARGRQRVNHLVSPLARLRRDLTYRIKRILKPGAHTYDIDWIYEHDVAATPAQGAA
jgi:salicylate hydroxylase